MSEDKRKVIHVKDLVIKADNVIIEQPRRSHYDPFFGPRRRDDQRDENVESSTQENDHDDEDEDDEGRDERRPFSWI